MARFGFLGRAAAAVGRLFGRGEAPSTPPQAPEAQAPEKRGGLGSLFGGRRKRERQEQERREQELRAIREELDRQRQELERQRQEQERREQERQERERVERDRQERERQELEKERREVERQRQELERQEKERQEKERVERDRQERERQEREEKEQQEREQREREEQQREEKEKWRQDLGVVKEIVGGKGWTSHIVKTPEELRDILRQAAEAGKRVTFSVHDKNGWHELYHNTGRGSIDKKTGMTQGGGAGISGDELLRRLDRSGIPGEEKHAGRPEGTDGGGGGFELADDFDQPESVEGPEPVEGPEILEGPEWDYTDDEDYGSDDYYDYIGDSEGGDEGDTEGYDPGSVNGYQVVVYA